MPRSFTIDETTGEKLQAYIDAHHDGDTDAAINDLLFCHKYITALMAKKAIDELKRMNNHDNP
jgi:hypothetical protein